MIAQQIAFWSLAALTLLPALAVVRSRNILHAGFWLIPTLIGVAGLFAALEAHFFFVIQILVYVGAILVLILFALMLTKDVMNPGVPQTNRAGFAAGLLCAVAGLGMSWVLANTHWPSTGQSPLEPGAQTEALGASLIGLYAVPFEVSSLLLLAALIGAIVLAKTEREPLPPAPPLPFAEEELETEAVVETHEELAGVH